MLANNNGCGQYALIGVQLLFEGGHYNIQGLAGGGYYSRAATIRGRRLFEGGDYSRAATIRGRRLFEGGDYSRAATIRGRRLFEGGDYSRAATIHYSRVASDRGNTVVVIFS